ncbi:OPT family oligopeptide transporter [Spelaeicoccus albus]|uniref:Putative OPT family oligopeptide transporter n=1 Tax=Spelaeicoccus albus TaxID=1280376 RepID=A0A7Z0D2C0_9MICO|nr:oligopeptide transporter, OPT family [Spelaeicoccus albus]NYI67584.1 putative OPT family oligopeptide transporter [Spelaeicoccus albus]
MATNNTDEKLRPKELTVRGIILGAIITVVFTAANVYLGLKAGLTFATSIPAAVISMAVLRRFRTSTIQENNIIQTIASSAGTLAAIIFVLPGLIMVGWWQNFPYWTTVAICVIGGALGVMYTVPLRRTFVVGSDLPFPEGVAAGEVLKAGTEGSAEGDRESIMVILWGGIVSAVFGILTKTKVLAETVSGAVRVGAGGVAGSVSLSFALIGIGHLVGLAVGIAMFVGLIIGWGILVPVMSWGHVGGAPIADAIDKIFTNDVRFVGAGAMAIAAIWALVKIFGPIVGGIKDAIASTRQRKLGAEVALEERDLPITLVGMWIGLSLIPIGLLLWAFLNSTHLADGHAVTITVTLAFTVVIGAVTAAVCGYMAGLIGSSNSPISGVGILVALLLALLIAVIYGGGGDAKRTAELVAYTIFATAIIFAIATISNDNLQDLKTGQLVGATPWKQQLALIIGVVFGAVVIAPVLDLLNDAFGFLGAPGASHNPLPAPQAALISSLVKGVLGGSLNWGYIGLGVAIGAVVIIADEILARKTTRFRLPPLAVGMGLYLPMELTLTIAVGAVLGKIHDRWAAGRSNPERARRLGVLLATGLIVGDSLWGVAYAGIVVASGKSDPMALVGDFFTPWSSGIGVIIFVAALVSMYRWTRRRAIAKGRRDS